MQVRTLEHTSLAGIAQVFNAAFADYFVKLQMTDKQLEERMIAEGVDRTLSIGAFDGDRLAGFILNAFDSIDGKLLSYNAGTGVMPAYRGRGLTAAMYRQTLPLITSRGAKQRLLEVITENKVAIDIYERVGYKIIRELRAYKMSKPLEDFSPGTKFRFADNLDDALLDSFIDMQPSWQYTASAIKRSVAPRSIVEILNVDEVVAYGVFNPVTGRVLRFGVNKAHRGKGIGGELFKVMAAHSEAPLVVINVDDSDKGIASFLEQLGFERFITQYEMSMTL